MAKKIMTFNDALIVLMQAATNDATGCGLGLRNTSDEWREQLSEAWSIAHKRAYGWKPNESDYRNAGMLVHQKPNSN
jgi:hypothetical protein